MKARSRLRIGIAIVLSLLSGCATRGEMRGADMPQNCGVSTAQLQRLREINADVVARGFAPGITLSIHCDGKPLLAATDGLADAARNRPMAENDLFRIYSMTKPLTSLAAMILVDDKKLKLDDPVAKYLPEFAATTVFESGDTPEAVKTTPPKRAVTVRDLLRHTAGLTYMSPAADAVTRLYVLRGIDHGGGEVVIPADKSAPVADINDFTRRLAAIPLHDQPGERFRYGNATDVLAAVIEKASGQRYRNFMAARILQPLKMQDTSFDVPKEKIGRLTAAYMAKSSEAGAGNVLRTTRVKELSQGKVVQVEDPQSSVFSRPRYIDFGGAGLVSTAADYQRFLHMLLNDGILDGVRVVSAGTVAAMTRNHLGAEALATPNLAAQGLGFGLGFAVFNDPVKAPAAVPRRGYFWGGAASTHFWVDPDRRITGVVMTQVFGGDVMPFYLEMLNTIYAPAGTDAAPTR
jgi:CubicO group peptidase (beta-lactamase class C family)